MISPIQRVELLEKLKPLIRAKAKENLQQTQFSGKDKAGNPVRSAFPKSEKAEKRNTLSEVAKIAPFDSAYLLLYGHLWAILCP